MKNLKKRALLFVSLFGLTAVGTSSLSAVMTNASTQEHVVVTDTFDDSAYKDSIDTRKWVSSSADNDIRQAEEGLSYLYNNDSKSGCEHTSFMSKNIINGIKSVQFDYHFDAACSRWFNLQFVTEPSNADGSHNAYTGVGYFTNANVQSGGASGISFSADSVGGWISVRLDITNSTTGKINVTPQGTAFDSSKAKTFTYSKSGTSLTDAYIGFSASHDAGAISIDNLIIESDAGTYSQDFSSFDLENDENFGLVKLYKDYDVTTSKVEVINASSLSFANANDNDYVYTKQTVNYDDSGIKDISVFDISFKAKVTGSEKIALVLGYSEDVGSLTKSTVVYEMTAAKGVVKEYNESGVQTSNDEENTHDFSSIAEGSTINLKYTKAYGLEITENGTAVTLGGATASFSMLNNMYGHVAFAMLSKDAGTSTIDNVSVTNNYYYVPVTKSVTHNFSNDFFGNEGHEDFYVHDTVGSVSVENGHLVWNGATDGTFFGSAYQYDNFILDFKLCAIYGDATVNNATDITANDKWLGLDLSRSTVDYFEYGSYMTLLTYITNNPDQRTTCPFGMWANQTSSQDPSLAKCKKYADIPISLFSDITYKDKNSRDSVKDEDAVCFRYVSQDGNLSLSLKKASETEFTKYYEYSGLELNGYFTLCCTGWTYVEFDDFSMANTSSVYTCADNESPETITNTVTEIVYDNQNNDINLAEEIRLNKNAGIYEVLTFTFGGLALVAVAGVVVLLVLKKKAK